MWYILKNRCLSKNTNEIEAKGYLTGHQDVSSLDDAGLLNNIAKTLRTKIDNEIKRAEGVENTIKDYTVNGKAISTNPSFTGVGAIKIANTKEGNTVDVSLKLSDPDNNLLVIDENGLNVKEVIDCGTYA